MVVAVREHTKDSIFAQAEARLARSLDEEVEAALGEIFKIARLRLRELVTDGDRGEERT
jgi:2-oxo-4-hydroxy-4-carboxy--5-ureidoimidazoline (OHCU) decarboxylase